MKLGTNILLINITCRNFQLCQSHVKVTGQGQNYSITLQYLMGLWGNSVQIFSSSTLCAKRNFQAMSVGCQGHRSKAQLNSVHSIASQCLMGFWWNLVQIFSSSTWCAQPNFHAISVWCQGHRSMPPFNSVCSITLQCVMGFCETWCKYWYVEPNFQPCLTRVKITV